MAHIYTLFGAAVNVNRFLMQSILLADCYTCSGQNYNAVSIASYSLYSRQGCQYPIPHIFCFTGILGMQSDWLPDNHSEANHDFIILLPDHFGFFYNGKQSYIDPSQPFSNTCGVYTYLIATKGPDMPITPCQLFLQWKTFNPWKITLIYWLILLNVFMVRYLRVYT